MLNNVKRIGWELSPDTMSGLLIVAYLAATGSAAFASWLAGQPIDPEKINR